MHNYQNNCFILSNYPTCYAMVDKIIKHVFIFIYEFYIFFNNIVNHIIKFNYKYKKYK